MNVREAIERVRAGEDPLRLTEKLALSRRRSLPDSDFVFPEDRSWPIQSEKQATTAWTWSFWPQHKLVAKKVRAAIKKKYPELYARLTKEK